MFNLLLYCLLLFTIANAQRTVTVTNEDGNSIIQIITTDPVLGPTTRAVSTITPAAPEETTTRRGPVGAPPASSGTPHAPIPFTYTTLISGELEVRTGIYTPRDAPSISHSYPTGTIRDFDEYLSSAGPRLRSNSAKHKIPLSLLSFAIAIGLYHIIM
ncbi:hypothetical protein FA15DRAFT_759869 [Coprinopsis marcescibilis]|uniref:Uncharacterized protein n=1 Tax=Coprinopsis marcescibilis TaxID=230819 RepID=A0A5C3KHW7_COPMA|nr:hypothetical protein FA15DRAFT_759869 [Coprinopsis marcescibilis]